MLIARKLVDKFDFSQTFSPIAIRVNNLANSESATMKEFEEVVQLDPILTVRLLRMVNNACFGLRRPIDTVARAIALLGMKAIRNLVTVDALKKLFKDEGEQKAFSRKNLWLHSAAVATLSQMISERIFGIDGEDAFMAGIMHDIGLVVEDQVEGELLRQSCKEYMEDNSSRSFISFEEEIIGTHHGRVGAMIAEGWDITWDMYNAIRRHHNDTMEHPLSSITCITQIADFFAARLNYSNIPGRYPSLPAEHLIEHTRDRISEYEEITKALPDELEKAKELYGLE